MRVRSSCKMSSGIGVSVLAVVVGGITSSLAEIANTWVIGAIWRVASRKPINWNLLIVRLVYTFLN